MRCLQWLIFLPPDKNLNLTGMAIVETRYTGLFAALCSNIFSINQATNITFPPPFSDCMLSNADAVQTFKI